MFSPRKTRTILFVPLPVSFFVVLFLFVLVFLHVLFSLFPFVLRSWQFLMALLLRPTSMVLDIVEGQGRGWAQKWPKFKMGQNRTSLNVPNLHLELEPELEFLPSSLFSLPPLPPPSLPFPISNWNWNSRPSLPHEETTRPRPPCKHKLWKNQRHMSGIDIGQHRTTHRSTHQATTHPSPLGVLDDLCCYLSVSKFCG